MDKRSTYEELEKQVSALQIEIVEIRKAKQEIEEAEAFHRLTLESISDTVIITDDNGKIIYVCPNSAKIFGLSQKQIYAKGTVQELINGNACDLSELRKLKEISNIEWNIVDSSGRERSVLITVKSVFINNGTALYVIHDITEAKKSDENLKKYKNIVSSTPDGIALLDESYKYILVNDSYEKYSGVNRENFIGKTVPEYLGQEKFIEFIKPNFDRCLSGEIVNFQEWFEYPELGRRFVDVTYFPYYDTGNSIRGIIANTRDITDIKEFEETYRQLQKMSARTERIAHIGSWEWEIATDTVTWSEELFRIFKLDPNDGAPSWAEHPKLFYPEDFESLRKAAEIAVKDGIPYEIELRAFRKDGETRICHARGFAELGENGKPVRLFGLLHDITERKHAEDALLASEEKYRSMMEAMKNDAYICSPDFRIEYMNPRMVSRIGHDATGEYCYKAIYGFDEKCSWCVFDQILQGEHVDYEVLDPRTNRYYSVTNSPIYYSSALISKLSILLDITEKKAVEAQLLHARKMESIGTMAGGIAHDFNNILYMITGNAELAMEDIPEWNPLHENLKEIKDAGLRAAGIVKQLLNFSQQVDQKFRPIGAVTVIKDAIKFLRSTIPTTIEIQKDFPDKDVTIIGDPVQINQVMMNLCINASQVMEETGGILDISIVTISIGVDVMGLYPGLAPGDFLKIMVRDTGPGIDPEIIGKIFDPYFTTKEVGKGSGMGLAVVHGIVKNHNGAITVDSKPGKGAIFTILFPVVGEKPVINAKDPEIIPKGNGEKILFIDDEISIVKMAERMLKQLGYEVETKTSPLEALERFQSKPDRFDLVITDMTMPQMTGAKLAEKLKDMRFDIPILMCTGYSPLIDEEKAQSIGISGYVKKPVQRRDIARTIRKVLDEAKG